MWGSRTSFQFPERDIDGVFNVLYGLAFLVVQGIHLFAKRRSIRELAYAINRCLATER